MELIARGARLREPSEARRKADGDRRRSKKNSAKAELVEVGSKGIEENLLDHAPYTFRRRSLEQD
jgi:hypothetical protein